MAAGGRLAGGRRDRAADVAIADRKRHCRTTSRRAQPLRSCRLSDEDLDLVTEDPEFYAWSAQQASLVTNGTG
jgi:hypothetical protein